MSKNLNLSVAVIAIIFFLSYFRDSQPLDTFGFTVNVWVFRILWLFIAVVNFAMYFKKKKIS